MSRRLGKCVNNFLNSFGFHVVRQVNWEVQQTNLLKALKLIYTLEPKVSLELLNEFVRLLYEDHFLNNGVRLSPSQLGQDYFAEAVSNLYGAKDRFFVEIGGGEPLLASNSFWLQSRNWRGILAEPNLELFTKLRTVRQSQGVLVTHDCITADGREVEFFNNGLLSRVIDRNERISSRKNISHALRRGTKIESITPVEFVEKYQLSKHQLSFLSLDTEGSEFEIIKAWPFKESRPLAITIEHSYRDWRDESHYFMKRMGYIRVMARNSAFDDWFVDAQAITRQ